MFSYFESRGGKYTETVFFGLQYLIKEYLTKPITVEDVEAAAAFLAAHGEPFNKEGWMYIATELRGKLPIRIRAVPEGTVVPVHNVLMTVECTDPKCFWVASWLETMLVRLWYPITVATQSYHIRKTIYHYLQETADNPDAEIDFKLHDFGSRGVTTAEQAALGGAAHLTSFLGSDTIQGIRLANEYYFCEMSGFSIPAAEHSTVSSWGSRGEIDFYRNFVQEYLYDRKCPIAACVSDTYDYYNVVENVWCGELHDMVKNSGGCLVIRPDSGDPVEVILRTLNIFRTKGLTTKNSKGYEVLPSYYRLIQGDGIDEKDVERILNEMLINGFSASNIAFGMGGGLLQKINRDTNKFAFKCSAALRVMGDEQEWFDVKKDPITDKGKQSKAGRLDLIRNPSGELATKLIAYGALEHPNSELETYFENGYIPYITNLATIRKRVLGKY